MHIKKPKISSADFYSLKQLFLDGVAAKEGLEAAQKAAGHTNSNTTRIYTVQQKRRDLERNKELKISFVNKDTGKKLAPMEIGAATKTNCL